MTRGRRVRIAPSPTLAVLVGTLGTLAVWAHRTRVQPGLERTAVRETRRVPAYDGTPLHVELDGDADADVTMVFVHGLLARSAEFDAQWERFRASARLVRFDHRGHGRSGPTRGPVTIDELGRDVESVLEAVVPTGRVIVVAHSMGGMALLSLASRRPDLFGSRVAGVALLATAAGHDVRGHAVETAVRRAARRHLLAPMLWSMRCAAPAAERLRPRGTRVARRAVRMFLFGGADATPELVVEAQRMLEEPPLRTVAAIHGSILRLDQRPGLAVLRRVPSVVVVGADDRLTRAEHSRAIASDLGAEAELTVLPGVGHGLPQSAPEAVNAAIDRLLARVRGQVLRNPSGSQTSPAVVT